MNSFSYTKKALERDIINAKLLLTSLKEPRKKIGSQLDDFQVKR